MSDLSLSYCIANYSVTENSYRVIMYYPSTGGELGGPMKYKIPSVAIMFGLWLSYVVISALEAYGKIQGF